MVNAILRDIDQDSAEANDAGGHEKRLGGMHKRGLEGPGVPVEAEANHADAEEEEGDVEEEEGAAQGVDAGEAEWNFGASVICVKLESGKEGRGGNKPV